MEHATMANFAWPPVPELSHPSWFSIFRESNLRHGIAFLDGPVEGADFLPKSWRISAKSLCIWNLEGFVTEKFRGKGVKLLFLCIKLRWVHASELIKIQPCFFLFFLAIYDIRFGQIKRLNVQCVWSRLSCQRIISLICELKRISGRARSFCKLL